MSDDSGKIPNLVLIQSWSEVIENLRNLKELSIKYQTLRGEKVASFLRTTYVQCVFVSYAGHLKRMLSGSVTREHEVLMHRQREEARSVGREGNGS